MSPSDAGLRLQISPNLAETDHVDGAWWPQSNRLAEELRGLAAQLSDRVGPVRIVGYHCSAWPQAPAQTHIDGQVVDLVGFTGDQPASVILIGRDGRHVSLSVIPPDTDQPRAQELLDKAQRQQPATEARTSSSAARNLTEVADKLAEHEAGDEQRTAEITRWVGEAAEQFLDAPIQTFVPILVEHVVRNRIFATRQSRIFPIIDMSGLEAETDS